MALTWSLTMTTKPVETTVINPSGRTIRPDDIDLLTLCNGDQAAVGGSLNRADYLIKAVK